jgi:hypothetical protein
MSARGRLRVGRGNGRRFQPAIAHGPELQAEPRFVAGMVYLHFRAAKGRAA